MHHNKISSNNFIFIDANNMIAVNNNYGIARSKYTVSLKDQNKTDVKRKTEGNITSLFKHI